MQPGALKMPGKTGGKTKMGKVINAQSGTHDPNSARSTASQTLFDKLPTMVEFDGEVWKKAIAGTGQSYYFNVAFKNAIWTLPDVYVEIDPVFMKPVFQDDESMYYASDNSDNDDDDESATVVEFHSPQWKRVQMKDSEPYFFNITTMETRWVPPPLTT